MSSNVFLIPKPGLIVRDPSSGALLPEGGAWKSANEFWLRLLRDGDVTEGKPPRDTSAAQNPAEEKPNESARLPRPRPDTGGSLDAPHHKRAERR